MGRLKEFVREISEVKAQSILVATGCDSSVNPITDPNPVNSVLYI
jgi:hypothetical protein